MRHLPNLICLARIALIWPVVSALRAGDYTTALVLFGIAAISDGLDGFLAKRFNWASELGKFLDPVADKLLLMTVFVTATWLGLVPWWLTAAAVARDVLIGLGSLVFRLWFGPLHGRPRVPSKINTALQLGYLLCVMVNAASGYPTEGWLTTLAVITFGTTVISGADYVIAFTRRAWNMPVAPSTSPPATGERTR